MRRSCERVLCADHSIKFSRISVEGFLIFDDRIRTKVRKTARLIYPSASSITLVQYSQEGPTIIQTLGQKRLSTYIYNRRIKKPTTLIVTSCREKETHEWISSFDLCSNK